MSGAEPVAPAKDTDAPAPGRAEAARAVWPGRDPPPSAIPPRAPRTPLVGLVAGALLWLGGRPVAGAVAAGVAALLLATGALAPAATTRALGAVGGLAARALSVAALGAVYLLVFAPLRLLRGGRDPLRLRRPRDAASCWVARAGRAARPERPF